jgi:hypothetical protein
LSSCSTLKMLRLPSESVLYRKPPVPPPVECSLGCIVFVISNHLASYTKYSSFFEVSAYTALFHNRGHKYTECMDTGLGDKQP